MTPILNLTVEGLSLDEYMAISGFSYSKVKRVDSTVTTMDGTRHSKWINKAQVSVSLFELNDVTKQLIENHLFPSGKNTVSASFSIAPPYSTRISGNFYVEGWSPKIKTIEAGTAYYDGLSFTLEEK